MRNVIQQREEQKKMRNVIQQSFVVFTIGEKSYTVVYQKYISIQNKAEMLFQMERHRTYFRTRNES